MQKTKDGFVCLTRGGITNTTYFKSSRFVAFSRSINNFEDNIWKRSNINRIMHLLKKLFKCGYENDNILENVFVTKNCFRFTETMNERYEIESIHLVEIMTCVSLTLSCVTLSIAISKKVVDTDKKSFLSVDNHSLFYVNFTCIVCVKCHAALIPENH